MLRESDTSPRQLERLFDDGVGLAPKRLARITRFQRALAALERAERRGAGTTTALACGYADQAHFIRDFKTLAGCPPGAHLLRRTELTGFFVSGRGQEHGVDEEEFRRLREGAEVRVLRERDDVAAADGLLDQEGFLRQRSRASSHARPPATRRSFAA